MATQQTYIYGKEIGKERGSKTSGKGTKDVYVSKWPFFTSLHFLRDNITPRKTSSNLEIEDKENEEVDQEQPSQKATQQLMDDSVFPTVNPPSGKNKRKKTLALEDELLATCLQEIKRPKVEEVSDADIVFGQYVSKQLKKIPEGYAKEMLKIEIQQSIVKVMLPLGQSISNLVTINFDE